MQLGCKINKWNKIMLLCYDIRAKEIRCDRNKISNYGNGVF
jgi:hypothetical protein